jgi:hypothetical protein
MNKLLVLVVLLAGQAASATTFYTCNVMSKSTGSQIEVFTGSDLTTIEIKQQEATKSDTITGVRIESTKKFLSVSKDGEMILMGKMKDSKGIAGVHYEGQFYTGDCTSFEDVGP